MEGEGAQNPFRYQRELNESINKFLSPLESIIPVKFVFLRLGSLCNASEINSFTSARCNIEHIKNDQNKLYSLDLRTLFDQGFNMLRTYKVQNNSQQLYPNENAAIRRLEFFFSRQRLGFLYRYNFYIYFKNCRNTCTTITKPM